MSNKFQVGRQYKLVDASKDKLFAAALAANEIAVPDVWTCSAVHGGGCWSSTEGVLFQGMPAYDEEGWFCATTSTLDNGAVKEATDAS